VHLWGYVGATNQQWLPQSLGAGNYRFIARHSNKCLDVRGVSTADGGLLQQYLCNNNVAQSFRLVLMP
jgi:glucosylceramidase